MNRLFLIAAIALSLYNVNFAQNDPLDFGNPSNANTEDRDNLLVVHRTFTLSYNASRGTNNWVAWHLDSHILGKLKRPKPEPFAVDSLLPEELQIRPSVYRKSGFDKGHMCPSADRNKTQPQQDETYVMSNMQPQTGRLNQQTWGNLENDLRGIVAGTREAYIFAGCFGGTKKIKGQVTIPTKCFKIILILEGGDNDVARVTARSNFIAAIFPNNSTLSTDWRSPKFLTSIDAIEKATGFDFFSELPDNIEKGLESRMSNK